MLNATNKIKFSQSNLWIYSFIVSTGVLFCLYFASYLFFTSNSLFLIIAIIEIIIATFAILILFKITKNE